MTTHHLLHHFAPITEAPAAVARLRQLVLDLAVRGKLVAQDPGDEPAIDLLKRIEAEKLKIIANGESRSQYSEPLDTTSIPFMLPLNWVWTQLAQVGIINPKNVAEDSAEASFIPMPMIFAEYGHMNQHEVKVWGEIKKGFTHFTEGDVGLAKITPCFENGKSTVFKNLTGGFGAGTTELHIVRPILVLADYILIFLKSRHFIETGIPKMTGTAGQKRLPRDYFSFSPFPLPPLAEQQRIVAKVDELMTLCDELAAAQSEREAHRDRLVAATLHRLTAAPADDPAPFPERARFYFTHLPRLTTRAEHIQGLRQTILNLAVQGKLVPQDPHDEPASEWLSKVQMQKHDNGNKSLRPVDTGDVPFEIPTTWIWVRFHQLFEVSGGIQKTPQRTPANNAFPYLGVGNVYRGRLDLSTVKQFELKEGELNRWRLEKGDLLIIEGNGSLTEIGRCAIWNGEIENCVHQNHVIRCRPILSTIGPFVLQFLNSPEGTNLMQQLAITSSGLYSLSVGKIREISIPLPPLAEQQRIVARVDELLALCDELAANLDTVTATRRRLLEAALAEALAAAA